MSKVRASKYRIAIMKLTINIHDIFPADNFRGTGLAFWMKGDVAYIEVANVEELFPRLATL